VTKWTGDSPYNVGIAAPVARSGEGARAQVYNLQRCRWNAAATV